MHQKRAITVGNPVMLYTHIFLNIVTDCKRNWVGKVEEKSFSKMLARSSLRLTAWYTLRPSPISFARVRVHSEAIPNELVRVRMTSQAKNMCSPLYVSLCE
jgi:hypothetical protein